MADIEFLEKWNNIIPFIISEHDLTRPTKIFLKNALIHYVKMLHIDTSQVLTIIFI